ncbi:MAG: hypothetical protein ACRC8S_20910 [Fimbriiglobus sp.]
MKVSTLKLIVWLRISGKSWDDIAEKTQMSKDDLQLLPMKYTKKWVKYLDHFTPIITREAQIESLTVMRRQLRDIDDKIKFQAAKELLRHSVETRKIALREEAAKAEAAPEMDPGLVKWYENTTNIYTEEECEEMLNRWDQYAREDAERYARPGFDLGTGEWDRSAESGESGGSGLESGGPGVEGPPDQGQS